MQTSMGKGCADAFRKSSLEEIKSFASIAAEMLNGEAKRLLENRSKMDEIRPYIQDALLFERLQSALDDVIKSITE
jgi:hypothetical protein